MKRVQALCIALDALALLSLALTFEVSVPFLCAVGLLLVAAQFVALRVSDRVAMAAFIVVILSAAGVFWMHRWPPLILVAHATPLIQAVIWFCADTPRWRNWRLTVAFLEVIVASSLSPDFFLSMITLLFLSIALFRVVISHVDGWCAEHHAVKPQRLPGLLIASCTVAMGLMLGIAGIIFPILPRVSSQLRQVSNNRGTVGYTEEVNVSDWLKLSGEGGGETLARVYLAEKSARASRLEVADFLQGGLLRGKVLDRFDGDSWKPARTRVSLGEIAAGSPDPVPEKMNPYSKDQVSLEIIREPIASMDLPLPYGTERVLLLDNQLAMVPVRKPDLEWEYELGYEHRVAYVATLRLRHGGVPPNGLPQDAPIVEDLKVPQQFESERMKRLGHEIFGRALSAQDKVQRLRAFFSAYHAGVDGESPESKKAGERYGMSPVERFLFIEKQGHCELFATAGAILLRAAEVPTRMIAGFRATHASSGGVLTLRRGDAHAWLEYWDPGVGWKPLDLTPRVLSFPSLLAYLQDSYDQVSGLWYRYVLSYESLSDLTSGIASAGYSAPKQREISAWTGWLKDSLLSNSDLFIVAAIAGAFLILISYLILRSWFPWVFSIRKRVRSGPRGLSRERNRMEQWVYRRMSPWKWFWSDRSWETVTDLRLEIEQRWGPEAALAFGRWAVLYRRLRFGQVDPSRTASVELKKLKRSRKRFRQVVRFRAQRLRAGA